MNTFTFFLIFIPILAIILLSVNLILAPHNPYQEKISVFECGFHSFLGQNRTQFSISFFIFGLLFLLFDLEILLMYPYTVSGYVNNIYGLIVMIIFFVLLTIGLIFELGKKALNIETKQTSKSYISKSKPSNLGKVISLPPFKNINLLTNKRVTLTNTSYVGIKSFSTTTTLFMNEGLPAEQEEQDAKDSRTQTNTEKISKKPKLSIDTNFSTGSEGLDLEKKWRDKASYCEHENLHKYLADENDKDNPMLCDFTGDNEDTAGQSTKDQQFIPKKHPAVTGEYDWAWLCDTCLSIICKNCRVEYPSEENTPTQNISTENNTSKENIFKGDSSTKVNKPKSSLLDDFADTSCEPTDYMGGDD